LATKRLTKAEKETRKEEARAFLLSRLKPGDTVYTILRHVSRSGMMRHIEPIILCEFTSGQDQKVTTEPICIGGRVSDLLGYSTNGNGAVKMGGCGMDMGFALVYEISSHLFDGERSGYQLKHSWM
jgi:hypothetical protein